VVEFSELAVPWQVDAADAIDVFALAWALSRLRRHPGEDEELGIGC